MIPVDVRQLEYFIALAEERHVGRAAARLHMTQPPLTRRLARLEREVGAALFLRTATGVELTGAGSVLLEHAYRVVQLTQHAIDRVRLTASGGADSLIVGYVGAVVFDIVPRLLRSFRATSPEVELVLERASEQAQVEAVLDGRMHLGIARHHRVGSGLAMRRVDTEKLGVVVPGDHRLAAAGTATIADLEDEPMVLFPTAPRPSFADEVTQLFARASVSLRVARETEDVVTAVAYVGAAGLCAIVPRSAGNIQVPGTSFVPMTDLPEMSVSCVFLPGPVPGKLQSLLDHIESGAASSPATVGARREE